MRLFRKKRIWALATITILSLPLLVGTAYGRMIGWASAEMIYLPTANQSQETYISNCLVSGGQRILLADWEQDMESRTVFIETNQPAAAEDIQVTVDAQAYLTCTATATDGGIQLTLMRTATPSALTTVNIKVVWQNLEGTFCINLLPAAEEILPEVEDDPTQETTEPENLTITGCGVVNSAMPVACIQLDPVQSSQAQLTLPRQMVRCSLDGGNTYTLLYDSTTWQLDQIPENWNGLLLLDFSQAELDAGVESLTVTVRAGELTGTAEFALQSMTQVQPIFITAAQLPHTITVNAQWGDAEPQVRVEKLSRVEEQLTYVESNALSLSFAAGEAIIAAANQPEPGTYRLVIQWKWNEISLVEQTIYLFINAK